MYGDFARGFAPTLIQIGTRDVLLSDSVRLYQALSAAQQRVSIDVYEGMPHVFQNLGAQTPEAEQAMSKALAFWAVYLRPAPSRAP